MKIRSAVPDDSTAILELAVTLGHDTIWANTDMNASWAEATTRLLRLIDHPDALVLVAIHEEAVVGCLVGEICSHIFLPHMKYFYEPVLYIQPAFRRKRAGAELWKMAKAWARVHGIDRGVYAKPKIGVRKNGRRLIEEVHWHVWGIG